MLLLLFHCHWWFSFTSHMTSRAQSPSRRSRTASTTNDYQLTASFHWTDRQTDTHRQCYSVDNELSDCPRCSAHGETMWVSADASLSCTASFKKENGQLAVLYYFNCFSSLMGRQREDTSMWCSRMSQELLSTSQLVFSFPTDGANRWHTWRFFKLLNIWRVGS